MTNHLILLLRMEEEQRNRQTVELDLSNLVEEITENFHALAVMQSKTLSKEIMQRISFRGDKEEISSHTSKAKEENLPDGVSYNRKISAYTEDEKSLRITITEITMESLIYEKR